MISPSSSLKFNVRMDWPWAVSVASFVSGWLLRELTSGASGPKRLTPLATAFVVFRVRRSRRVGVGLEERRLPFWSS